MSPTIHREGPYRFFFYSKEGNEPAHVHVDREEMSAKVWLANCEVASNDGYPAHELKKIIGIVKSNRDSFLEAWHDFFG